MHITLEFSPEEGTQLREQASRKGSDMGQYAKELIVNNLQVETSETRSKESLLLETINQGFPEVFWKRFRHLERKRKKYIISEPELQELIGLTEQIEAMNVERIKALIELSKHWQIDLDVLIKKLGPLNGKNF